MEVLTILEWLLAWGMLLFAQSVFINGVYQSATGETKKRVDGSDEDSEMILYWLKKFFEKTKKNRYKYIDSHLFDLKSKLHNYDPKSNLFSFEDYGDYLMPKIADDLNRFKLLIPQYEAFLNIKIKIDGNWKIYFFKEEDEYKYSKWFRKPLIQCIKCMSSFWGALTFWPVVLFIFGFHWLEIPIFFADVFSLTYLNWILYKRAQ